MHLRTGTISGTVMAGSTPVERAFVVVRELSSRLAISDAEGVYQMAGLPPVPTP